jgi:endonuclease YncB( thermonuclease family)
MWLKVVALLTALSVLVIAALLIFQVGHFRQVSGAILVWLAIVGLGLWLADRGSKTSGESREWGELGRSLLVGGLIAAAVWMVGNFQREDERHHSLQLALGEQRELPGIDLHGEDLGEFDLAGKNLSQADLSRADLTAANLQDTNLSEADLDGATLTEADLEDANLANSAMDEAKLEDVEANLVDLRGASLAGADLSGASLSGAQMEGACLADARLNRASLPDANLDDAALTRADLSGAKFWYDLRPADLRSIGLNRASHAGTARWPPGFRYGELVHPSQTVKPPSSPPETGTKPATVRSVFDGDTLTLAGLGGRAANAPVRLIGIDAPDRSELGGIRSRVLLERLLPAGARVRYRYDRRREDAFERRLLYVFSSDGRLANQVMVQHGLAVTHIDPPSNANGNRLYSRELAAAETWAREHGQGLWHSCPP